MEIGCRAANITYWVSVRGGKRKRFYKVTAFGKKELDHVMNSRRKLWDAIPASAFQFNKMKDRSADIKPPQLVRPRSVTNPIPYSYPR